MLFYFELLTIIHTMTFNMCSFYVAIHAVRWRYLVYHRRHAVGKKTLSLRKVLVSRWRMFQDHFCSSKQHISKQAWQTSSYFSRLHCAISTYNMATQH